MDVNTHDEVTGNAPIHAIVTRKKQRDRAELLLALLIYGNVKIDLLNRKKMTALHLAIEVRLANVHRHVDVIVQITHSLWDV